MTLENGHILTVIYQELDFIEVIVTETSELNW
jgi:hypothetical protein